MAPRHYLDVDLLIEPRAAEFRAYVLASPVGEATHSFARLPVFGALTTAEQGIDVGTQLFTTVFAGEVETCLRRSLDAARRQEYGLRIRLRVAHDSRLANLPWEYLYDPLRQQFLCLSTATPLMRYMELPERVQPLEVTPPLRMLVLIAGPLDYPPLDVEREWAQVNGALAEMVERGLIAIERLNNVDMATLQQQLRQQTYHILHFIGHGDFADDTQQGVLIFGSPTERGHAVSGQLLGTLLHDHPSLRLIILNACEGARTATTNALAGVAQRCVQHGVPAVIAMQDAISDQAAISFGQTFYASLADGYPIDAALAEGRKAIYTSGNALEWALPVLHLRAPDGVLWNMPNKEPAMSDKPKQPWWEQLPPQVDGDMIIANIGAGASGVAVGKHITQIITNTLGDPQPTDKQVIEQQLAQVAANLEDRRAHIDPNIAMMAQFQLQLLQGELTKINEDEQPSASTMTMVGDWLLDNVPQLAEALASLFATPAVGKVVGKAGEAAVAWVRRRFGAVRDAT